MEYWNHFWPLNIFLEAGSEGHAVGHVFFIKNKNIAKQVTLLLAVGLLTLQHTLLMHSPYNQSLP